jgi:hypothetical protein
MVCWIYVIVNTVPRGGCGGGVDDDNGDNMALVV